MNSQIVTKQRIEKLKELRNREREEGFSEALPIIGKAAVRELRELYSEYDERFLLFAAKLYDPELSAFYYSKSARDTQSFLPDAESTMQIYRALERGGNIEDWGYSYSNFFPKRIKDKTLSFILSLQDEDGFFYHPQWGKEVTVARRGRDLTCCSQFLSANGVKPKYLLPTDKTRVESDENSFPMYLKSISSLRNYLSELGISRRSLAAGNLIDAQAPQIRAAGEDYCNEVIYWMAEHQRSDTGLWEDEFNYLSVHGCSRLAVCHEALGGYCPNAQKVIESMVRGILLDDEPPYVFAPTAPWSTISSLIHSMASFLGPKKARDSRGLVLDNAADMIAKTRENLLLFRRSDGSSSYFAASKQQTSEFSQGAPISVPMCDEGDANSSGMKFLKRICGALGIPDIPVYTASDIEFFIELLENAPPVQKKNKNPYGESLSDLIIK